MQPMRLATRKREEPDLDITPMIDITFLLLIFFLVATRIDSTASAKLPEARHGVSTQSARAVHFTVLGAADLPEVFTSSAMSPESRLSAASEEALRAAVESHAQSVVQAHPEIDRILVFAAKDTPSRQVSLVTSAAAKTGLPLFIAVIEQREGDQ